MNVIAERDPATLRLHDAAHQVPRMRPEEWDAFLADVDSQGVLEPIVCTPEGVIVDGRHRWEAAKILRLEALPAREVNLTDLEQVQWVFRAAVLRRHLNDDQRAVLAARMREPLSAAMQSEAGRAGGQAGGRGRPRLADSDEADVSSSLSADVSNTLDTPLPTPPPSHQRSRAQVAEQFNVSERKVKDAISLEREAPALAEQVLSGDKSLREAQRERVKVEQAALDVAITDAGITSVPAVVQARNRRKFTDAMTALLALEPDEVAQAVRREEVASFMGQLREWCEALDAACSDPLLLLEGGKR